MPRLKKPPVTPKLGRGQPTKYKPEYNDQAYRLCLLGYTDAELARYFGVTETSINNWKTHFPDFFESLNNGRERADSIIAKSLFEKAAMGDTTATIFWLKNRRRNNWRDKQDIEQSGSVELKHKVDLSALTPAELAALEALVSKAAK